MAVPLLFRLPDELRTHIWELIVVSDKPIQVGRRNWRGLAVYLGTNGQEDRQLFSSNLNIAFVCRRLWQEITPIYYSYNMFKIVPPNRIPNFVRAIGPSNAKAITKIETSICTLWFASFLNKLLPCLASIDIGCFNLDCSHEHKRPVSNPSHEKNIASILLCYPSITLTYRGKLLSGEETLHRESRTR